MEAAAKFGVAAPKRNRRASGHTAKELDEVADVGKAQRVCNALDRLGAVHQAATAHQREAFVDHGLDLGSRC